MDAERRVEKYPKYFLHFEEALYIDLTQAIQSGDIPSVGAFVQSLLVAAEDFRQKSGNSNSAYHISDTLGLAYAKKSIIDMVWKEWGKYIGASRLQHLAVRRLGNATEILPGDYG